jgi:hypothetical protein
MYAMPEGYKEAIEATTRDLDAIVAIGYNIDQTASDDIIAIEGSFLPLSNPSQLTDANYLVTEWMATFEGDGIHTPPSAGMLAPPIQTTQYPPEAGLWSEGISDADGAIDWTLTIRLSKVHESALTLYLHAMSILEGTVSYYIGDELKRSAPLVPSTNEATDTEGSRYDRIVIHVTRIDRPYTHIKLAEMEFGSARSYNKTQLSGTVSFIQEYDPTMQSIPLYELDFTILNVLGDYDPDNPNGSFDSIKQDYPCELAIQVTKDGQRYSVPCGRFQIAEKSASDTELTVVAYDARLALQNNHGGLTLSTTQSFGDLFTALFDDIHMPFQIADSLFSLYPDQDMRLSGDDYDLLTCFLFLEQYYNIWLVPSRAGYIEARSEVPSDDYGLVNPEMMTTFPLPHPLDTFNYVQVSYGTGGDVYEMDMRVDPNQAKSMISISNPLVQTQAKAQEIAQRILTNLYHAQVETQWRADPTIDMNDTVDLEGKWTAGNATEYKVIYQEITYDGALLSTMRSVR